MNRRSFIKSAAAFPLFGIGGVAFGQSRARQTFFSEPSVIGNERVDHVKLYLPARTAIVLSARKN